MTSPNAMVTHYAAPTLLDAVRAGFAAEGRTLEAVTIEDLAAVDEFHIGGRAATAEFLERLAIPPDAELLDIGCGVGGTARLAAHRFGARVHGFDLTPDFIRAGREFTRWTGLDARVQLEVGDAATAELSSASYDFVTLVHVGMNIADKRALFRTVARVLRPGGTFGVFDVMRIGPGEVAFPVPWASTHRESHVETPDAYEQACRDAGMTLVFTRERHQYAIEFFEAMLAKRAAAGGRPARGLHLVMGETAPQKIANLVGALRAGTVAPVEMVFRARGAAASHTPTAE